MSSSSTARHLSSVALRFPEGALTWHELRQAAAAVAHQVDGCTRVAIWAEPSLETAIGVIGALLAGVTVVPLNPGIGTLELDHILRESRPEAILCGRDRALPAALDGLARLTIDAAARRTAALPPAPDAEAPALIIYTSGTTGLPKGAILSSRAIAANLDGLAQVWRWTPDDLLVHALPLFHVHGLVLGTLGPVRIGSPLIHAGRFSPEGIAAALDAGGTMLFGVPTMYHRLAKAAESDNGVARALAKARVLVSGSAPLAAQDRDAIARLTGRRPIERYGLTETLIVCAMPAGDARDGVGPPVPGLEVRLVDDDGEVIDDAAPAQATQAAQAAQPSAEVQAAADAATTTTATTTPTTEGGATTEAATTTDATASIAASAAGAGRVLGEVEVRGASLFSGYLDRPDATTRALHDGWFRTGDTAIRDASGAYTIVGRTALDVIKTGGFKVGAGEVEDALRQHPDVAEVAVTGEHDADLGQRIVAWVVCHADRTPAPAALEAHVAGLLSAHKRPRDVRFLDALPRNAMGKIEKRKLA